ncbi:UNVERIFIED_CONTAM: hypothetical protein K2H54_000169 [Gekko kuhli]
MTHRAMTPAAQQAAGISAQLLRLSVGIEHGEDLVADLAAAFAQAQQVANSLADPVCYRRVASILEQQAEQQGGGRELVVVSAAGKTTNRLIQLVELAEAGDEAAGEAISALQAYQQSLIDGLLEGEHHLELSQQLADDMQLIAKTLEGSLTASSATACSPLASFLRAEDGALVKVDTALSSELLKARLAEHAGRIVVTGFIAADMEGRSLLLGRNGSDYSASLLALLADGESTTIWSDVAGVYSADPRRVKEARLLERLSLAEANELARLGSSVLHSRTLQPVADSRQRLTLRCSYNPDEGCTHILRRAPRSGGARIVSSVDQIALIELKRQPDRRILRLAYTLEVAQGAFELLRDFQLQGSFTGLIQREGYSLVALVGAGVTDNAEQCHRFYQLLADQPLEFVQGNIGGHWLNLYAREKARLEHELNLALTLYGVFSSEGGLLDERDWIRSSETVSRYYPDFAQLGIHIIAANKFAGAADSGSTSASSRPAATIRCNGATTPLSVPGLPIQSQHPDAAPER